MLLLTIFFGWGKERERDEVLGSTPGWVTIEWLLLGWVTVYGQVNNLGI